jgi:hypothetical protein
MAEEEEEEEDGKIWRIRIRKQSMRRKIRRNKSSRGTG